MAGGWDMRLRPSQVSAPELRSFPRPERSAADKIATTQRNRLGSKVKEFPSATLALWPLAHWPVPNCEPLAKSEL